MSSDVKNERRAFTPVVVLLIELAVVLVLGAVESGEIRPAGGAGIRSR
jgi:flagellin-like protein